MLYSSGTTGHPKGIRRPLTPYEDRDKPELEIIAWRRAFGFDENTVYLSTAPFYHAAPLRYIMRTLDVGGTCVAMAKYDAEGALAAVERYRVTHSQWVPTMFVRLLGLPDETRRRYDLSSMKVAIHAAAPCPVHVKQAMLDWWGDILYEYYAGSEGAGTTSIGPLEWRKYPGSVGRASAGVIHIVDEAGNELPPNEVGMIYFSGVATFSYHNAREDAIRVQRQGLGHLWRPRLRQRGRVSVPERPARGPDPVGRRERLSAGNRKRADAAPVGGGRRRDRRARSGVGRGTEGRDRTA
jgi:acyl-CoA synthetase (AMP-forming)/AMP-acid ligase II